MNLGTDVKISNALDYASGTAVIEGEIIDMEGFDGVLMIMHTATIAGSAVSSIKAQQHTVGTDSASWADLLGTSISIADDYDDQLFVIDLVKPLEQFVRIVLTKDTSNALAGSATYIQYQASKKPVVQNVTDLVTYEKHISPIEGTA